MFVYYTFSKENDAMTFIWRKKILPIETTNLFYFPFLKEIDNWIFVVSASAFYNCIQNISTKLKKFEKITCDLKGSFIQSVALWSLSSRSIVRWKAFNI